MAAPRYVLDSNILSAYLKKEAGVGRRVKTALQNNAEFLLCPVVFYEVYRGLLHRDAKKQLAFFLQLADAFTWDDFDRQDWEEAAQLWARLYRTGQPTADADLLIGVYALRRGATIVTDNERHFTSFGTTIENWRRS